MCWSHQKLGVFPKTLFQLHGPIETAKMVISGWNPKKSGYNFFWIIPFITWGYWLPLEEAGCSLRLVTVWYWEREVWFEDSHRERCLVILVRSYQDVIALAEGGVKNRFLKARAERCWFMLGLYPCSTKTMEVLRNNSLVPRDFPRPERLGVEGYIKGCEVRYWIFRYLLSFGGLQTLSHNQSYPKGWIKKSIPLGRLI